MDVQRLQGIDFGSRLHVEPYADPVGEVIGVDPRSAYVTRFWLPFLGPTTTLLMQLLAGRLDGSPEGFDVEVSALAFALGLGERPGRHGPFVRALTRAVDYRLAAIREEATFALRRRLPPLPPRLVGRLPAALADEHARLVASPEQVVAIDALARRGRQLALSLLALGESVEEAERQLLRWRFSPPLARRCSRWAAAQSATDQGDASLAAVLMSKSTGTDR